MMAVADDSGDGEIEFAEFVEIMSAARHEEEGGEEEEEEEEEDRAVPWEALQHDMPICL